MVQTTVGCLKTNKSTKHVLERVMVEMFYTRWKVVI